MLKSEQLKYIVHSINGTSSSQTFEQWTSQVCLNARATKILGHISHMLVD